MITLLVALLLKPFIEAVKTSEGYYDAVTCGLPTDDHMEPSNKRSSEMEHDFHLSTETTVGANDEYDYDYMSQDNMQEERDDDGDDPMQTKVMGGARASNGELPWAVFIEVPNGGGEN
ncbi:hypothetical protein OESDEN_04723 [Oesophagostomum dentatum]|uniref:Uncharacterized protein n=1 Tax=Oesophagostomum dentatum TaxID=61180 RepID=A0A0B1TCP8_OESDE|nr:hypothetical protein OESDEN_04723 [Oesophagostomum dentatum]